MSERVLWPHAPSESNGLEDARFVRFVGDHGSVTYFGTYTAFDGLHIAQHILDTKDFRTFRSSPMIGAAAVDKGLALFPRRVNGQFVALTRSDRESNEVAFSDDLRAGPTINRSRYPRSWEMVQLGNCGSPIETEAGWLVLTHGVGPMRTYSLGALLLDLDDPRRGRSPAPTTRSWPPVGSEGTGMSRTWSTPVGRSLTATCWWCRTAWPTSRSPSPPAPSPTHRRHAPPLIHRH